MFLYVKVLLVSVLFFQMSAFAQVQYYAEPHLSSALYQEFQHYLPQTPLGQIRIPEGTVALVRLLDYRRQDGERAYWSQVRLDQQQQVFVLKLRLELWREHDLFWQSTVQVRRSLKYLSDEVKAAGQPLLGSFLSQEAGLLYFPVLSGAEETQIRKALSIEASRLLRQDLERFLTKEYNHE